MLLKQKKIRKENTIAEKNIIEQKCPMNKKKTSRHLSGKNTQILESRHLKS